MFGLSKKAPPCPEPIHLWAFWRYDLPPYVLSGKVIEQCSDGCVLIEGYGPGSWFRPFYMASGAAGHGGQAAFSLIVLFGAGYCVCERSSGR